MIGDIMQPTHLLFVFVIALLVLGPKRLPEVGRQLGKGIRDFRAAISGEHSEDEDQSAPEDDVLAPAHMEPAVEPAPFTAPAESHAADETVTHSDTPAEHEFAGSTVESSTLPSDHQFSDETTEQPASPTEHEFAAGPVEQPTLETDHGLPNEVAEPANVPIAPATAHVRPDSAPADGNAAESTHTAGDHSVNADATEPAETQSDRVA